MECLVPKINIHYVSVQRVIYVPAYMNWYSSLELHDQITGRLANIDWPYKVSPKLNHTFASLKYTNTARLTIVRLPSTRNDLLHFQVLLIYCRRGNRCVLGIICVYHVPRCCITNWYHPLHTASSDNILVRRITKEFVGVGIILADVKVWKNWLNSRDSFSKGHS